MLVADFYSKPLQGKLFRLFRNLLLNLDDQASLAQSAAERRQSLISSEQRKINLVRSQECVKHNNNVSGVSKKIRTYRDVCLGAQGTYVNDTRHLMHAKDPSLLVKLRSASKMCIRSKS